MVRTMKYTATALVLLASITVNATEHLVRRRNLSGNEATAWTEPADNRVEPDNFARGSDWGYRGGPSPQSNNGGAASKMGKGAFPKTTKPPTGRHPSHHRPPPPTPKPEEHCPPPMIDHCIVPADDADMCDLDKSCSSVCVPKLCKLPENPYKIHGMKEDSYVKLGDVCGWMDYVQGEQKPRHEVEVCCETSDNTDDPYFGSCDVCGACVFPQKVHPSCCVEALGRYSLGHQMGRSGDFGGCPDPDYPICCKCGPEEYTCLPEGVDCSTSSCGGTTTMPTITEETTSTGDETMLTTTEETTSTTTGDETMPTTTEETASTTTSEETMPTTMEETASTTASEVTMPTTTEETTSTTTSEVTMPTTTEETMSTTTSEESTPTTTEEQTSTTPGEESCGCKALVNINMEDIGPAFSSAFNFDFEVSVIEFIEAELAYETNFTSNLDISLSPPDDGPPYELLFMNSVRLGLVALNGRLANVAPYTFEESGDMFPTEVLLAPFDPVYAAVSWGDGNHDAGEWILLININGEGGIVSAGKVTITYCGPTCEPITSSTTADITPPSTTKATTSTETTSDVTDSTASMASTPSTTEASTSTKPTTSKTTTTTNVKTSTKTTTTAPDTTTKDATSTTTPDLSCTPKPPIIPTREDKCGGPCPPGLDCAIVNDGEECGVCLDAETTTQASTTTSAAKPTTTTTSASDTTAQVTTSSKPDGCTPPGNIPPTRMDCSEKCKDGFVCIGGRNDNGCGVCRKATCENSSKGCPGPGFKSRPVNTPCLNNPCTREECCEPFCNFNCDSSFKVVENPSCDPNNGCMFMDCCVPKES